MNKKCTSCEQLKSPDEFGKKGKYHSSYCRPCDAARAAARRESHGASVGCPVKNRVRAIKYLNQAREDRASNNRLAHFVLADCKSSDRKKGRECDLDREFVEGMVSQPCSYCGLTASEAKITLDRINNDIGHLRSNVVTSCYRCNIMRSDMPYEVWLMIAPTIRTVAASGAFGDWKLWPKRREHVPLVAPELPIKEPKLPEEPVVKGPRKGRVQKITDDDYIRALNEYPTICQALTSLGIAAKGSNYTRAKRLLGYSDDVRLTTNGKLKK